MDIPEEFEIERKYNENFGKDLRKFKFVKKYKHHALYECYKKDKDNKDVHLFYESFKYAYLYNEQYKTDFIE